MPRSRWELPDTFDHLLLLGAGDAGLRAAIVARLAGVPGRGSATATRGRYPRFKVLVAQSARAVRRRCGPSVGAAAIDLAIRGASGLELIRELREAYPELPILAYAGAAPASEAIAAVMAGADFFHDCSGGDCAGFESAVEHAVDRRRLIALIDRNEAQVEEARGKLAQLSGDLVRAVPGFRPLHGRGDVLPFREAARRYLLAAAQLFEGDPRGLAKALGVSYFALRRLLARYEVPYPTARSRKHGTRPR
ncbi:MAG TPA: response regulator [Anaeromyxobacter sp.]|nr:response regulator [Anaeromyxobacter sp.]